jgi:hypothetical protein
MAGVAVRVSDLTEESEQQLREAGLVWLRSEILDLDQACFFRGEEQPETFYLARAKIAGLRQRGFQVMGITPGPKNRVAEAGEAGSREYFANYQRLCAYLGHQYRGLIDYWQVANELDIWIFRATLTLEQSVEFLKAGLRGLKEADKNLQVGINITLFPSKPGEVDGNTDRHEGVFIARSIYQDPQLEVDYAGFDSYPGTWREGGAESWNEYLDAFHELTGKPIIIQEFGYSSAGDLMSEEESRSGAYPCEIKKWKFTWKGGHTPEAQANFITESYRIFAQKPFVIGATYYCWRDHATCWQCGRADCPAETAWGLVDRTGQLKPSYHSLKASLALRKDIGAAPALAVEIVPG